MSDYEFYVCAPGQPRTAAVHCEQMTFASHAAALQHACGLLARAAEGHSVEVWCEGRDLLRIGGDARIPGPRR
jgi:hypothetical protein